LAQPSLGKIGLISYALPMYHQTVNGLVRGILFNREPRITEWEHWLAAIAVLAISVGLATLSYIYFETPIRRYAAALAGTIASTRPLGGVARGAGGGE